MRILTVPGPASSHVYAAAPLAWALQNAGHEVRVAGQPSIVDAIAGAGLVAVPVGEDFDLVATLNTPADLTADVIASLDLQDADPVVTNSLDLLLPSLAEFLSVPHGASVVDAFAELIRDWRPDLVVWDSAYFPAAVAAQAAGVPHARLLWGRDWVGLVRQRFHELNEAGDREDVLARGIAPLLEHVGLEFDEQILTGQVSIDPNPEEMRFPTELEYLPVRWVPYTGPGVIPAWMSEPAPAGRVCVSLGVSYREFMNDDDIPIVAILRGLAELGPEVVATVDSRQVDPAVHELPDNVRLVDYVPLSALLGSCSAIVHHGGTGTWGAALQHSVPQVVAARPQIDYPAFGEHTEQAGAGVHVPIGDDPRATAEAVVAGVERVLKDPSYAERAADLLERTNRAPSPVELVARLEEFAVR